MVGIGIGVGIGLGGGPGLDSILAGLASRSKIAGRDGTITCTRASQRTCIFTGALLANNVACYGNVPVPGIGSLRMYGAFNQRTNLINQSSASAAAWGAGNVTKSTNGSYTRLTDNATSGSHRITTSNLFTPPGSVAVNVSCAVGPDHTIPYLAITLSSLHILTRVVVYFNLDTGAFTDPSGQCTGRAVRTADGGWLFNVRFTTIAAPGANSPTFGMSQGINEIYVGSGQYLDIKNLQTEAWPYAGPSIPTSGTSVQHLGDLITWDGDGGFSGAGEVWSLFTPFMWDAAAGVDRIAGTPTRLFSEQVGDSWRIYVNNLISGERTANGVQKNSQGNAPARDIGKVNYASLLTDSGFVSTTYVNKSSMPPSTAGTSPWVGGSNLVIGNTGALSRPWDGAVALGWTPGGLTAAERNALATIAAGLDMVYTI